MRPKIVLWVNEGGGEVVDEDQNGKTAHFIVERHGMGASQTNTSRITYVTTHWIHSCLEFSQYTCPRCNTRYCLLPCYKSHSVRCTESFMRENVMGELHQVQPDEESKSKMLDILKRFHEEEETDSYDEEGTT